MISKLLLTFLTAILLLSCGSNKTEVPNTDIDVAKAFIKNVLDNNFKEAEVYVLKNEDNEKFYDFLKSEYRSKSKEELENYKNSDIIINEISNVSDSVTVINYANTYKKVNTKVKMVKVNEQWLVDLKYTFSGNL